MKRNLCPDCETLEDIEEDEKELLRLQPVKCDRCKQLYEVPIFKKEKQDGNKTD
jgi:phage FluMu protein Com